MTTATPAPAGDMPLSAPPPAQAWLFVTEVVYFQSGGGMPEGVESRFMRQLASDERPYPPRPKVGAQWCPLECGWLADGGVGLVVLANEVTRFRVIPTPEEKAQAEARIIEVGVAAGEAVVAFALVRPGESARFEPADVKALRLRCRAGEAKVSVTLIPR